MPKITPIIFSGPMVRALLTGRKSQTRRLATSPLRRVWVGDRLYVRERFRLPAIDDGLKPTEAPGAIWFDADGEPDDSEDWSKRSRPAIHLPRDASRLTLHVRDVNFERLQTIARLDALAEGLMQWNIGGEASPRWNSSDDGPLHSFRDPVEAFAALWNSLHGKPGERWEDNPEIVALTFDVLHHNVDRGEIT